MYNNIETSLFSCKCTLAKQNEMSVPYVRENCNPENSLLDYFFGELAFRLAKIIRNSIPNLKQINLSQTHTLTTR